MNNRSLFWSYGWIILNCTCFISYYRQWKMTTKDWRYVFIRYYSTFLKLFWYLWYHKIPLKHLKHWFSTNNTKFWNDLLIYRNRRSYISLNQINFFNRFLTHQRIRYLSPIGFFWGTGLMHPMKMWADKFLTEMNCFMPSSWERPEVVPLLCLFCGDLWWVEFGELF